MADAKTPHFEYMLASFVQPLSEGDTFQAWPLHITLVPWFDAPSEQVLIAAIHRAVKDTQPFIVQGSRRSTFGWGRAVPVTVLESDALHALHSNLIEALLIKRMHIKNPTHTGSAYVPHITKKGSLEFEPGSRSSIDHVAIIKAPCDDARGRTKTVIGWIKLQNNE